VANALLLFAILTRVLLLAAGAGEGSKRRLLLCAALGAVCWAINPLRVEPVAWASARIYCVSGSFALLSVWAYLRGFTGGSGMKRGALWVSVCAYGLSVFTYPITLAAPVVFVVLDVFALRRLPGNPLRWCSADTRPVVLEKALFLIPAALMLSATLWAKFSNGHVERIVTLEQFSVPQRLMQGCYVLAYYLWKPWLPDSLAPKYAALLEVNPVSPVFLASAALVAGIAALLWFRRRTWPMLAGAWLTHLALLVPVLGLTEHPHHTFDRYSYFQGTLWAVVIAAGLWKAAQTGRWRLVAPVAVAACLLLFGIFSVAQVKVWNNSLNLQTRMVASLGEHPEAALHETVRGVLFMGRGDRAAAEASFRHAIQLNPGLPEPWRNLGDVLSDEHQPVAAMACYREAIKLNPADVGARLNLSIVLGSSGQLDEAATELREALRLNPNHSGAHHNLAITLNLLGRPEEARLHQTEAERLRAR
jgi:tetratricopeptide (TPR) repeat protein